MQNSSGMVVKAGVLALALALTGCGGGGNSTPAAGAPAGVTPERTVQGTAAKGLIKGAKVSIYALDAQGVPSVAALATAITETDGTYKLQLAASVQNFVIEVTSAPGAVMADEVTGLDLPLPDSIKLRSVVMLADTGSATYDGTVSPFTEMVARTAQTADGKLPREAVENAKKNVRTLLGFDPEYVKPINSNSAAVEAASEDEKNQSLALAAISKMGNTASDGCAQDTPGERISCVVTKLTSSVTVKEDGQPAFDQTRLAQFKEAIEAVARDKTINRTGKDKVVGIPLLTPTPGTTPTPVVPALPPLEATKALFSSLRTNLHALSDGDAFRATADGIKADLDNTVAPLGNDVGHFALLASSALEQFDRYRTGESTAEAFQVWNSRLYAGALQSMYSYYYSPGDGNCVIVKSPLSMRCTITHLSYLPDSYVDSVASTETRKFVTRTVTFLPKENSASDFTYTTSFAKNAITQGYSYTNYNLNPVVAPLQPMGPPVSGDLTVTRTGNTVTQIALKGRMPSRMNDDGTFQGDYEDWSLNANRTDEDGVAHFKFGGVVTAIAAGQPAGQVEIDNASFVRVAMVGNDKVVANAANELQVTMRGSLGSTAVDGTVRVSGHKQDKSKTAHMPTELAFSGSLKHKDATVFSGNVAITRNGYENFDATAPESDTNFVKDSVEIGGTLSVPSRPALGLTLGATRTGKDSADITAQYRDGTAVINASVTAKVGERRPLVKVSSAEGVSFSFADTTSPVLVTKDGVTTAQIDLNKGIISYNDGTTESLN